MALEVRDVMTADPDVVSPDTSLATVAETLLESTYSGLPVCVDGEPVGVVEVGDLLPRPGQVPATTIPVLEFQGEWVEEEDVERFLETLRNRKVEEVMREEFTAVPSDTSVGEILTGLVEDGERRILVVDDEDQLIGVVTRTDLLRLLVGRV